MGGGDPKCRWRCKTRIPGVEALMKEDRVGAEGQEELTVEDSAGAGRNKTLSRVFSNTTVQKHQFLRDN